MSASMHPSVRRWLRWDCNLARVLYLGVEASRIVCGRMVVLHFSSINGGSHSCLLGGATVPAPSLSSWSCLASVFTHAPLDVGSGCVPDCSATGFATAGGEERNQGQTKIHVWPSPNHFPNPCEWCLTWHRITQPIVAPSHPPPFVVVGFLVGPLGALLLQAVQLPAWWTATAATVFVVWLLMQDLVASGLLRFRLMVSLPNCMQVHPDKKSSKGTMTPKLFKYDGIILQSPRLVNHLSLTETIAHPTSRDIGTIQ